MGSICNKTDGKPTAENGKINKSPPLFENNLESIEFIYHVTGSSVISFLEVIYDFIYILLEHAPFFSMLLFKIVKIIVNSL